MFFLYWYLSGVVGSLVLDYYDNKHKNDPKEVDTIWIGGDHMFIEYLVVSLFGLIVFGYALWVLFEEEIK